ncbi:MAG TPA: aldo/keto reductase [Actinomycetota bacterium]|jgi:aryl-alcohol dehydrogenase-like predicted oxidoreductase|nr:aldo/keto reductase [Actinomycetota bacterium]
MEYRTLGTTGVKVSTHCLGAMMFGAWGNTDEDECVRMIHAALDAGVNFIDTADVYSGGQSEEIVGRALKDRRDDVVLATKVHGAMGQGVNRSGNSRLWIMREVEDSLRRLQTDHIDLYQIHRPDPESDLEETLSALTDLIRQGKARYIGCSTFPAWQIVESHWISDASHLSRFVCEQPPYSIFVRGIERDILKVCSDYGMGVIVWSPLAGGWLAGRYRKGRDVPKDSRAERFKDRVGIRDRFDLGRATNQRKLDLIEDLVAVADKAGVSLTHLAVSFTLSHPAVTSAIIGPRTMGHLEELLAGADVRLDDEVLDAIDEIVPPGEVVEEADKGWKEPWLAPEARRR